VPQDVGVHPVTGARCLNSVTEERLQPRMLRRLRLRKQLFEYLGNAPIHAHEVGQRDVGKRYRELRTASAFHVMVHHLDNVVAGLLGR
jgi:hypothetical protein